jgi:hypothetical protein
MVTSAAATNLLSLLGGCRICDITLLFEASIPFDNFENQQQDKATDTGPNKPVGVRPTEQTVSVRDIGVRPSFGAFNQVVPAGPPRHDYLSLVTGNKGSDERDWRFGQGNTAALSPHHGSVCGQRMADFKARWLA